MGEELVPAAGRSTSSRPTAAARSPTTAPASSSAIRSCASTTSSRYVRTLEQAIVAALRDEGIAAPGRGRGRPDSPASGSSERKIASIGVHVSARRDDARVRGQRRQRPAAVRVGRALRPRRRADDLDRPRDGRAGPLRAASACSWRARWDARSTGGPSRSPADRLAEALGAPSKLTPDDRCDLRPAPAPTRAAWTSACSAWARTSSLPRARKPPWFKVPAPGGARYRELRQLIEAREPPHGLPGGGLPEHRRVLGARHRDVHDPRRHLHAPLRLLQRQDRQADLERPARAGRASPARSRGWACATR